MKGNIHYQKYGERIEIDMIGEQKWSVILGMLWLACHNPKINWKIGEVKMMRYLEECRRQWRPKQGKPRQQKQKEEEKKQKEEEKMKKEKKKTKKKSKTMNVKKGEKEWEIWDKGEKATRSEEEVKKLVPEQFHR